MIEERLYKIEQPDLKGIDAIRELTELSEQDQASVRDAVRKTEFPEYLHWQDIKYKSWIPKEFKNSEKYFWAIVKFFREDSGKRYATPIRDESGQFFTWEKLDHHEKMLHEITLDMSKYLLDFPNVSDQERTKYQLQGIAEEAIASSQLEGAHSTRRVAKQMIKEKKTPKTFSEKMILNNFSTMKAIQERFKDEKLSLDILFEIHQMLTSDTMEKSEQGNFRTNEDKIVIQKGDDPSVVSYVAPSIEFVEKEIVNLIAFANDELEGEGFVHPVIKAIMIHFWIGLLHPFVDGNGRLARALFYWYLMRKGYWAFALLPISLVIKNSPNQYAKAYVLSEQDDNDLTYFIDYNLRKVSQSIENFRKFFAKKSKEMEENNRILEKYKNLNLRQIEALTELAKNPDQKLTLGAYKNIFNISKVTAIKDLQGLLSNDFVTAKKQGRNVFYFPTKKLDELSL
jgi:Fic family protein